MTLTDVATIVFLVTGIARLVIGEYGRTPGVLAARRALVVLWLASGVGFAVGVANVLGPILRWIMA